MIEYYIDVSTPTINLPSEKCLISSNLSTHNEKLMLAGVNNFYLNTDMERYEYINLRIDIIPEEIIVQCDLRELVEDAWVYTEIMKGIYGLQQARVLANQKLKTYLVKYRCISTRYTAELWTHTTTNIKFTLCIDGFLVKYVNANDEIYLLNALRLYRLSLVI